MILKCTGVIAAAALTIAAAPARLTPVDPARLGRHVEILASDAFGGRFPGSAGETKTIAYIARQFAGMGLRPGGDVVRGKRGWFQIVPMIKAELNSSPVIAVTGRSGRQAWTAGREVTVRANLIRPGIVDIAAAPLVFIGYGVDAPDRNWNDYKSVDLHGKIAVVLGNDPDSEGGEGDFGGKAVTSYGFGAHKVEQALKRGAVGVLFVHDPVLTGYAWATVSNSDARPKLDIVRTPAKARAPYEGSIDLPVITDLFRRAGLDFEAARRAARTRAFAPVELGATLSIRFDTVQQRSRSRNVVGILPGRGHPGETVLYGAHWDHIGTGAPDASGDRIYHGAIDNAAGVASLIELARTLAQRPRADRSQTFVAFTLEEVGILGSEYYALHPVVPLAKTAAVVVFDGPFPMGPARDFSNWAQTDTTLSDRLVAAGARQGRRFTPDAHTEQAFAYRTDHAPFAKRGVPPIFFQPGQDLIAGGLPAGTAFVQHYLTDCYHRQCDRYDPRWSFAGSAQDITLIAGVGYAVANSRDWPKWRPGAEFAPIRDRTAAARRR